MTIEPIGAGRTRMSIESRFPSTEAMEQVLAMGMEEGLTEAVGQIDAILAEDRPCRMTDVSGLDVLLGEWHAEGLLPIEPPMRIAAETTVERLGAFIVIRSLGEPAGHALQPVGHRRRARTASRSRCTTSTAEA